MASVSVIIAQDAEVGQQIPIFIRICPSQYRVAADLGVW